VTDLFKVYSRSASITSPQVRLLRLCVAGDAPTLLVLLPVFQRARVLVELGQFLTSWHFKAWVEQSQSEQLCMGRFPDCLGIERSSIRTYVGHYRL